MIKIEKCPICETKTYKERIQKFKAKIVGEGIDNFIIEINKITKEKNKKIKIKINMWVIVMVYFIIHLLLVIIASIGWYIFPEDIIMTQKDGFKNNTIWIVSDIFMLYGLIKCYKQPNKK